MSSRSPEQSGEGNGQAARTKRKRKYVGHHHIGLASGAHQVTVTAIETWITNNTCLDLLIRKSVRLYSICHRPIAQHDKSARQHSPSIPSRRDVCRMDPVASDTLRNDL